MSHVLHLGDGIAGMAAMPDRSVTHWICDPPYSEHVHSKSRRGLTVTHRGGATDEISERRDLGFTSLTPETLQAAAAQFARTAQRWILVFSDVESSHLWRIALEDSGAEYVRTLAWVKLGGAPQFTGDRPAVGFEAIIAAHARGARKRWNGGGKAGVYLVPTAIDRDRSGLNERMHTTQKPLELLEELIRDFTDPDDLVGDAFAGSATALVAAKRLDRAAIGWELDPAIHARASSRLSGTSTWWRAPQRRRNGVRSARPKQLPLSGPEKKGAA